MSFRFHLTTRTYWPGNVVNLRVAVAGRFGLNRDRAVVRLLRADGTPFDIVHGVPNYEANKNGTPRVFFREQNAELYRKWKLSCCRENGEVEVSVQAQGRFSMRPIP